MDKAELKEQPFIESSIETMDTALFNYLNGLEFQTTQQGEAEKVPLIWSSSERVYTDYPYQGLPCHHKTLGHSQNSKCELGQTLLIFSKCETWFPSVNQ